MLPPAQLAAQAGGESSASVAARVAQARAFALQRQGCTNARLGPRQIDAHAVAEPEALALLQQAALHLGWSSRGYHRVLKVARTIADLAASPTISRAQMAEALQLRRGLPGAR